MSSANVYHKIGTTFRTSITYPSPTAADTFITGLTQSDFTINVMRNGTAGYSTTGITITENASTAGLYDVVVSGTTGFAAATGLFVLTIYRTADVGERWVMEIFVSSDGTGAGSWGDAAFTASASDGRVLDGSSTAVAGATVRIVDSSNVLYVQTTTTAAGLWGPVYFNANGTYTAYVQKSGYTTASATITVTGSTATGPGADLTITAVANSGITASSLWAHFKRVIKDRAGSQADLLAQHAVDDALTMIAQEREWPYLHTYGTINIEAAYSTGTVALTNGSTTATFTGATLPSWAGSAELYYGGAFYRISTRDSGTQVTLATAFGGATVTGASYVLAQTRYTLPSDLMMIDKVILDSSWPWEPQASSMATISAERMHHVYGNSRPTAWAIFKDQLQIWPYPTTDTSFNLLYYRRPALLTSANDEADFDPLHLSLIRRAIEYQASLRGDCIVGPPERCLELYREALTRATAWDKTTADHTITVLMPQAGDASPWGTTDA